MFAVLRSSHLVVPHLGVGLQVVVQDVDGDGQVAVVKGVRPVPALGTEPAPLGHRCVEVAKGKQDASELGFFAALLQCFLQRNSEGGLQLNTAVRCPSSEEHS